jgi:Insertion element 4 transposase N-terminal/Transposase DDE domain
MDAQGRSLLSADEQGRVMDRMAALESVISRDTAWQALRETNRVNPRRCRLSHEVMLYVVLAMGLFTHLPIRQVFRHARRLRADEKTPGRSSLCEGRQRLGVAPLAWLHEHVVRPLATPETPGAFYNGMRCMGIDGTVLDVPESRANAAAFDRASGGRGEGAFPQVRKVSLVELGTHVEVRFVMGGFQDSEQTLARQLWEYLPADALLFEDRGLFSYSDWKTLDGQGRKLLARVRSDLVLTPFERLSDKSFLARIYRSAYDRSKDRGGIVVRVMEYTLDDPQRSGHQEVHRLMTNLFDEQAFPAMELIEGYHQRWEHELVIDEQKTHQDPRRAEKPAQLRSETPQGVLQELYALSIGHFVIRALMFEAARGEQLDPRRLSFTGCFRILQCRLPECDTRTPQAFQNWYEALLREMREERLPPRRNRINPRVIKRKMSKWPKKRPLHRGTPPLRKTFVQTVVMLD